FYNLRAYKIYYYLIFIYKNLQNFRKFIIFIIYLKIKILKDIKMEKYLKRLDFIVCYEEEEDDDDYDIYGRDL
ncbi:hypothetical protein, partial [Brachyspira hampsonii]|uniref:hypothetical protein n=1 Tax=Brachyspira hampsonii TaxID=1287055 RepID=UPI001C62B4E1